MSKRTYLDYNASAPIRPEVRAAMNAALDEAHNASSVHSFGREARKKIEEARAKVAALVGAPANQVIFNSGATEANNTVLKHFVGDRILVSAIEHLSVLEAVPNAERIPVIQEGIVDLTALEKLLEQEQIVLVSVMLVNNETGVIQPLAEVSALAKKHGTLVHCDAVQAASYMPIDMQELGIDFLTLSAHKLGGPQGVGALAIGLCGVTPTLIQGGGQERRARGGTENVAGIVGFGVAAELAKRDLEQSPQKLEGYRTYLETELSKINQDAVVHGQGSERVANTLLFSTPGTKAETLLMALDLEGVAVSNGAACTSGTVQPSYVLKAMGTSENEAVSALRISMGWDTTQTDLDHFLEAWSKIHQRLEEKEHQKAHA